MKKLILIIALIGLSFGVKAQSLTYQLDTLKYTHGIQLEAPGTQNDLGYYQPVSFYVQIQGCPYPEFEIGTGCSVFIPNAYINAQTPQYVYEQILIWIANKYQ